MVLLQGRDLYRQLLVQIILILIKPKTV